MEQRNFQILLREEIFRIFEKRKKNENIRNMLHLLSINQMTRGKETKNTTAIKW